MSSLAEVARHAGVSKATASRALSGAAHVSGRTRNVGVVTPFISRWFFGEVIEGIEEALIDAGYDLSLFRVQEDPDLRQRVFDYFLVRKRVDAVITVCVALSPEEIRALAALGKPVVGIGGGIAGMSSLRIDDVAASRLATEHLLSLGHQRILHVGGDQEERMDFHVHAQRLAGFRQAMATAGHRPGDDFAAATEFTIAGGFATGLRVLGNPATRPSAIVAASDEVAIQVPRDLSVVGIDDHDLAEMFGLTTVRQVPRAQGRDAVGMIMASIDAGEITSHDLQLPLTLRVRSSTSAPQPD